MEGFHLKRVVVVPIYTFEKKHAYLEQGMLRDVSTSIVKKTSVVTLLTKAEKNSVVTAVSHAFRHKETYENQGIVKAC